VLGGAEVYDVYECNGKNYMLGVIPTGRMFMSSALCITVYIHYLHVAAAYLYSLPTLTSQGDCTRTINFHVNKGIFQPLEVGRRLRLSLAGERAGRWNEVGEWGDMYYNY